MKRWWQVVAIAGGVALASGPAWADAVDEAFARGNEAASSGDWEAAIAAYEETESLLDERNSLVSYNLGTAYAMAGELGRATFHLSRATDFRGGPSTEVLRAARENLEAVRRNVELEASLEETLVDRPATSWELAVKALSAQIVAWVALISGWALMLGLLISVRIRRWARERPGVMSAGLIVLAVLYAVPGALHWGARRVGRLSPEAVVLDAKVVAREGPGPHRREEFELQGGSRVRVVDGTPGWRQVRLPGGVAGWVPEGALGILGS